MRCKTEQEVRAACPIPLRRDGFRVLVALLARGALPELASKGREMIAAPGLPGGTESGLQSSSPMKAGLERDPPSPFSDFASVPPWRERALLVRAFFDFGAPFDG